MSPSILAAQGVGGGNRCILAFYSCTKMTQWNRTKRHIHVVNTWTPYSGYQPSTMILPLIARFMGPTWGPSGGDRTQVGPMLAPWTLLSGSSLVGVNYQLSRNCAMEWMVCLQRISYRCLFVDAYTVSSPRLAYNNNYSKCNLKDVYDTAATPFVLFLPL